MQRTKRCLPVVCLLAAFTLVLGCNADTSGIATLTVSELVALLQDSTDLTVFDANSEGTRKEFGIIPGAKLLSDYDDFDVAAELPAGKANKLVFYCSSEACSSAPNAARKAMDVGYTDVHVLPVGIKGWVEAKQPVEEYASAESS